MRVRGGASGVPGCARPRSGTVEPSPMLGVRPLLRVCLAVAAGRGNASCQGGKRGTRTVST